MTAWHRGLSKRASQQADSTTWPAPFSTQTQASQSVRRRAWARLWVTEHEGVFDLEALDEIFDGLGRFRIEGAGGFIHEDDLGRGRQRAGQAQALLLADRELQAG